MSEQKPLSANVNGSFAFVTADGIELKIRGAKERALLAMLVLSPGQSRPRAWLQDRLWSTSPPEKGAASLRRVLSNIRSALGPHSGCFDTDRSTVRFRPEVRIDADAVPGATLLEDVDGQDPEFDHWLTSVRAHEGTDQDAPKAPWLAQQVRQVARIRVEADVLNHSAEASFAAENLATRIASRLQTLGPVEVELDHQARLSVRDPESGADTLIRIQGSPTEQGMSFNTRIQRLPTLQFCGLHRASVREGAIGLPEEDQLAGMINKTVRSVLDVNAPMGRTRPYYAIQNAVRRIYSGERDGLAAAEVLLRGAQHGEASGIALAWRAFLRLTEWVEFRQDDTETSETAVAMSEEATRLAPRNAIVWALASHAATYIAGDYDLGMFYAKRASDCADDDPYAFDALSNAAGVTEDRHRAFELAERGRRAAEGLENVYNWDMQCCIAAVCVERLEDARRYAQDCHWKMPSYRPALRYLTALNLLLGNRHAAEKYADRLSRIETDFSLSSLADENYQILTIHRLGLTQDIRSALAA